jgi:hypothetical protein
MVPCAPMRRVVLAVVTLLAGLGLLDPWPLLVAGRSKAAPKPAPEEPSIFAPAAPPEPTTSPGDASGTRPPATPSQPADLTPEQCVKIRTARHRLDHYLVAENRRLDAMIYPADQVELRMAASERRLQEARAEVREAWAAYARLADDLLGKVPDPWPACEAPK